MGSILKRIRQEWQDTPGILRKFDSVLQYGIIQSLGSSLHGAETDLKSVAIRKGEGSIPLLPASYRSGFATQRKRQR